MYMWHAGTHKYEHISVWQLVESKSNPPPDDFDEFKHMFFEYECMQTLQKPLLVTKNKQINY